MLKTEQIELTNLNYGYYLVVVDAYRRSICSSFTLELNCDVNNEENQSAYCLKAISYENRGTGFPGQHTGHFTQNEAINAVWYQSERIGSENYFHTYHEVRKR